MEFHTTTINNCYEIRPDIFEDSRGSFVKTFSQSAYIDAGLRTDWKEEYYSVSTKDVLRGMHFQVPPHEHAKLVACLIGEIRDVVVDLRKNSPTYGQSYSVLLSSKLANCLYIPEGLAHGFLSITDEALVTYHVTSEYQPESDAGILWNTIGYDWGLAEPIISGRDAAFPSLNDFDSPFL